MAFCPKCRGNHSPDVPCSALQEEHLRNVGLKPVPKKRKYSKKDIAWNKTASRILLTLAVLIIIGVVAMVVLF